MKCLVCGYEYSGRDICPRCGQTMDESPVSAWHLKPGTVLKRKYRVGKSVGSGGFGVTYFAWDCDINRSVAIKEYLPGEFATRAFGQRNISIFGGEKQYQFETGLQKYVDEARRLAQLEKIDGLAQIYDYFQENGTAYIVMEFVPGITFAKYLDEKGGKIKYEEAISLMLPIMEALKEVHEYDIIHRDISPDNILITPDNDVKLIDFGASRYATTVHSKSLSVILKPGYAPEEQYRSNGEQGPWSDIYAVGATLYKAITGIIPEDSMERKVEDRVRPINKFRKLNVPKNVSTSIMNALLINHEYRYQRMDLFIDDLISDDKVAALVAPVEKGAGIQIPKKTKKILLAATGAAALVAGFFIAKSFFRIEEKITLSNVFTETEVNTPDFVGMTLDEAGEIAKGFGVQVQAVDTQNSVSVLEECVMEQDPTVGTVINTGDTVNLIVSLGPERLIMPDVQFQDIEAVKRVLKDMGFRVNITEEGGEYAPGTVLEQEFDPNELVEASTKIDIVISSGMESIVAGETATVPDVIGKLFESAKDKCLEEGLYILISGQEWHDSIPAGQIMEQSLKAGLETETGDVVGVTVSKGIEQVIVPSVLYKPESEAISLMEENKLNVVTKEQSSETVKEGHIISQSLDAQSVVDKNTTVTIVVSTGAPWSEYIEELPSDVLNNPDKYETQEKTQYRSSEYTFLAGDWSDWSSTSQSGDFADTQMQYRTSEYTWSAGDWSSWSSSTQSGDFADTQTQYRTNEEESTTSTDTSLSGWTRDGVSGYSSWGSWSSWSTSNPGSETDNMDTDSTTVEETTTKYKYGHWKKPASMRKDKDATHTDFHEHILDSMLTGVYYTGGTGVADDEPWQALPYQCGIDNCTYLGVYYYGTVEVVTGSHTEYRYRTRDTIYTYTRWTGWSSWETGTAPSSSSTLQVEKEYRYQAKDYFWTDWSSWILGTAPTSNSELKTEQQYRYQAKEYYWSDWSSWGDETMTSNDELKVETRTVYSYRIIAGE